MEVEGSCMRLVQTSRQKETMEISLMFSGHYSCKLPSIAFIENIVIQHGTQNSKYYPVLCSSYFPCHRYGHSLLANLVIFW